MMSMPISISKLNYVQDADGSLKIVNSSSQSTIFIPPNFSDSFLAEKAARNDHSDKYIKRHQFVSDIVSNLRTSSFDRIPIPLLSAMCSALGSSELLSHITSPKPIKYYDCTFLGDSTLCTPCCQSSFKEWELCNYRSLGNSIRRGDNVEFLSVESGVYLVRDYNAPKSKSVGDMDPAADVRMRSLIWVLPGTTRSEGSALSDFVLVLKNEYIWKKQYLNEIDPTGHRLTKLLYSKEIFSSITKRSTKVEEKIHFSLKDHHKPVYCGAHGESSGASGPTQITGAFSSRQLEANQCKSSTTYDIIFRVSKTVSRSEFFSVGMGVMLRIPGQKSTTAFDTENLDEIPLAYIATAPKTLPCVVKRTDVNASDGKVSLVVDVLLDQRWINNSLMTSLGFHSLLTTNLELTVPISDIERSFLVSPALLLSSAVQIDARFRSREYDEMFVVGHLDFGSINRFGATKYEDSSSGDEMRISFLNKSETIKAEVTPKSGTVSESQYNNTCVLISLLEFLSMDKIDCLPSGYISDNSPVTFRRTLPPNPAQLLDLLSWRATRMTMIGPSLERYRYELGSQIENFARSKSSPRRKTRASVSESSPNTLSCRIPGRMLMGLLGLFVSSEDLNAQFDSGLLAVKVDSAASLGKLLEYTMPALAVLSGKDSELVFDFNEVESNCIDGYVHLYPPFVFKWQMYHRSYPGVDRVYGPSEGVSSISFKQFAVTNIHNRLVISNSMRVSRNKSELLSGPKCSS